MTDAAASPPSDTSIVDIDLVLLDADAAAVTKPVIGTLAALLAASRPARRTKPLLEAALAREAQSATGLPGGIAIPTAGLPRSAGARRWRSPGSGPRWISAPRTVRRIWCS